LRVDKIHQLGVKELALSAEVEVSLLHVCPGLLHCLLRYTHNGDQVEGVEACFTAVTFGGGGGGSLEEEEEGVLIKNPQHTL
jgi:hypothetical protein